MSYEKHHRWAHQLPDELWEIIKSHLDSRLDVYRWRAVCRSWRSFLPLSHLQACLSPLHLPPLLSSDHSSSPSSSYLFPFTICRLEPINPSPASPTLACLTRVEESIRGDMQLLIPLSNQDLKKPSQRRLDMTDFRLVQLGKSYSLKSPSGSPVNGISKTLVLRTGVESDVGLEILCLFREGKLGFWRCGDPEWTQIDQGNSRYDDVILHKEQIYVVDRKGIVWWMNSNSLELIMYSPPLYLGGQRKKLVESEGHLHVVDLYLGEYKRVTDMRVYELDEEWGTWVHVPCLGDRLFVLGKDYCFSASAIGLSGWPVRNCIFFTDSYDEDRATGGVRGYHTRVFRLDDRRTQMVAHFTDHICTFSPPPGWLSSQRKSNLLDVNCS